METRVFSLIDADRMVPLIRQLIREIRSARSRLDRLSRLLRRVDQPNRRVMLEERQQWRQRLKDAMAEAADLGVEITHGIRCEAWIPFDHKWSGPLGDGMLRPAYFVLTDVDAQVELWFFSGWPNRRRSVPGHWRESVLAASA